MSSPIEPTPASSHPPPSSASSHQLSSTNSSVRPSSRASLRPPSSLSLNRPHSRASERPSSSASTTRPASSASTRPLSRVSHRPASRFSQRPPTRQSTRLLSYSQTLVAQVSGLSPDDDEETFRTAVDVVSKALEHPNKGAPSSSLDSIDKQIQGHARKARINSLDSWASALENASQRLKVQVEENKDLDQEVSLARLPDHLQLLVMLSLPPAPPTLSFADVYLEKLRNPPNAEPPISWQDILAEEPFEGQHWEGVYGLPPGSTVEGWETKSLDSTPPFSPLPSRDLVEFDRSISPLDSSEPEEIPSPVQKASDDLKPQPDNLFTHRQEIEDLQVRQYWRTDWHTDAPLFSDFDIGNASTLGPSISRILGEHHALKLGILGRESYIHEFDAVREILMGLQGHKNLLLRWAYHEGSTFSFEPASDAPRFLHLTTTSQLSILQSFAKNATILEHLRKFVACINANVTQGMESTNEPSRLTGYHRRTTRTVEAYADAVDSQLRAFNRWCADQEKEIYLARAGARSPLVVSLLSLETALGDTYARTFEILLDSTRDVMRRTSRSQNTAAEVWALAELPARSPPSVVTSMLLDTLLTASQESLSNGDLISSTALMRVLVLTAEPVWSMVGRWLKSGMPIQDPADRRGIPGLAVLDDEFFVEDNGLVIVDPDFWTEGYVLRDGTADEEHVPRSVPSFLKPIASSILRAGKAIGLLRALDIPVMADGTPHKPWLHGWTSFSTLLQEHEGEDHLILSSADDLSRFVYDELLPHCQTAQGQLANVIVNECDLWSHLTAIENLFLMRKGDVMSSVSAAIFAKMDAGQPWSDFHFLNSAFRDTIEASGDTWINPSLVRLSYRGRDTASDRTTKVLEGLWVEYAAPFPLTYVFAPQTSEIYCTVFVFLLQIHRAKTVLERILVRGAAAGVSHKDANMKVFYALRSKFSWFIHTLLDFISTHVIHGQVLKFHASLRQARSLDEIVKLHIVHLTKLECRCLLQGNTLALKRAILSILDMSLHFSECFVAFAGDTTHDASRQILVGTRHRSRRQRRQRKNIISFSQTALDADESSDSDSELEDEDLLQGRGPEPSFSMVASVSFEEEGFASRVQKMTEELDGLVRYVRRGVESLAGGATEAASTFGIFAFALEDWDN
ncbi:hypothetical protein BV25DRAFT_11798 [Artomyces pyxidatus]|uniref:Uncharacterized protein n=1 Tax=Artomyces pyxidatus TaxID=48021 RepID=A0ACB8TJG7_9AGAM|nr:hypothetical protein BV25DRAFT_11798 [Artomyces pyxidatus]